MTIHNPQNEKLPRSPQDASRQKSWRSWIYQPMSMRNPFDYLRLLFWILFRPDMLKIYRIRCDIPQRLALREQALWLISHLLWGSLLLVIVVPLAMSALPVNGWMIALMLAGIAGAWFATGQHGLCENMRIINRLILGNLLVAFGIISIISISLYQSTVTTLPVIVMGVIAVVAGMMAVSVASIFRLKSAEKIAAVTTLVMVGGLSPLVFDLMEAALIPVSIIIIAIFMVGVIEDRYDMSKHR